MQQSIYSRLEAAVRKGVWLLIRQSTMLQQVRNKGSAVVQREQARYLAPFGLRADDMTVVDARGESGARGAQRTQFKSLLEAAEAGRIGVLLLARHDRLGRNDSDSSALFDALRRSKSLVMVDGRCFDPCEAQDKLLLNLQAQFAEYENSARTRWVQLARWALIRRGAYRVVLPTGLVWASPDDPEYLRRLKEQGLEDWVTMIQSDPARFQVSASGRHDELDAVGRPTRRRYYPLPLPDAQVVLSAQLRIEWLLETRSMRTVLQRIGVPADAKFSGRRPRGFRSGVVTPDAHPAWPVPGKIPVFRAASEVWTPTMRVQWRDADFARLSAWYRSPALFGIYAAKSSVEDEHGTVMASGDTRRLDDPLETSHTAGAATQEEGL